MCTMLSLIIQLQVALGEAVDELNAQELRSKTIDERDAAVEILVLQAALLE